MRATIKEIPGEIERGAEGGKVRFASPQAAMVSVVVTFFVPVAGE